MVDTTPDVLNADAAHIKWLADRMVLDTDKKHCVKIYMEISKTANDMTTRAARRIRRLEREKLLLEAGRL
jgi:hypothetical protein